MPVAEWFNRSAPAVKSGIVDPDRTSEEQALTLMLEEPLLIRRPLLQVGGKCRAGFDLQVLEHWIGVTVCANADDLESCPHDKQQDDCR
jgi:nitrogenase-associated protein